MSAVELIGGRYRVESKLGEGGFSVVYRCWDEVGNRTVAVKLFNVGSSSQRWLREAAALRALDQPGIVRILDEGLDQDRPWIAMELVDGSPFPGRQGPLSWDECHPLFLSLLDILARVHARGIVHRDLKPDNVLVATDGRVVMLDFGLSRGGVLGKSVTRADQTPGTPAYLAPEQLRNHRVTRKTDLYTLGLLFYQALTGEPAHAGKSLSDIHAARLHEPPPSIAASCPDVPPECARVLDQLLAVEAVDRPDSVLEVLAVLDDSGGGAATELPWLGSRDVIDALVQAGLAGESIDVWSVDGGGKSRALRESVAMLEAQGVPCQWARPSSRPLGSLDSLGVFADGTEVADAATLDDVLGVATERLEHRMRSGVVLAVDAWERIDSVSREAFERARGSGAILGGSGDVDRAGVRCEPLHADVLEALFHGPRPIWDVPRRAALELWERTDGVPKRIETELKGWTRAGVAKWEDGRLRVPPVDLERLRTGLHVAALDSGERRPSLSASSEAIRPLPESAGQTAEDVGISVVNLIGGLREIVPDSGSQSRMSTGFSAISGAGLEIPQEHSLWPHPEDILTWLAIFGRPASVASLAVAMGHPRWRVEACLQGLQADGWLRVDEAAMVRPLRVLTVTTRWDATDIAQAHAGWARALPPGNEGRWPHVLAAGSAAEITEECRLRAAGLLADGNLPLARQVARLGVLTAGTRVVDSSLDELVQLFTLATHDLRRGDLVAVSLLDLGSIPETPIVRACIQLLRLVSRQVEPQEMSDVPTAIRELPAGLKAEVRVRYATAAARGFCISPDAEKSRAAIREVRSALTELPRGSREALVESLLSIVAYISSDYEESVERALSAARIEIEPIRRASWYYNAANSAMAAFRLQEARTIVRLAIGEVKGVHTPAFSARLEWLLLSLEYRLDLVDEVDSELLVAVKYTEESETIGAMNLTASAVHWRAGRVQHAREAASRAAAAFVNTNPLALALTTALRCQCDEEGPRERIEELFEQARTSTTMGFGVQVIGLIAQQLAQLGVEFTADFDRLARLVPAAYWSRRMEVLSVEEAQGFVHRASASSS